ncbi:hypothetical protein R2362_03160 [Mycobacteroides chelonae]|nr:hypothetical protein [Mycobacteroides chelonae]
MSDYYHYLYTPWFSFGVDRFDHKGRISWSRNRTEGIEVRVPVTRRWTFQFATSGKSYRELVGAPEYLDRTNWIIDEFDSSFNDLACASLRYHMDHSVCYCDDKRRAVYQDIHDRLMEPEPDTTDEESAAMDTWDLIGPYDSERGVYIGNPCPPEASAAIDSWEARIVEWRSRQDKARHDFVDIMRGLWS